MFLQELFPFKTHMHISASSDCSVAVYDFLGKKIGVCGQVFIYIVTLLYYMSSCFNSNFQRCTTLCDKVCQWIAKGRWFSPGLPFSSTNSLLLLLNASYLWFDQTRTQLQELPHLRQAYKPLHQRCRSFIPWKFDYLFFSLMMINTTFNNISVIPEKTTKPAVNHWQAF
jgi:hypothetical protein